MYFCWTPNHLIIYNMLPLKLWKTERLVQLDLKKTIILSRKVFHKNQPSDVASLKNRGIIKLPIFWGRIFPNANLW